MTGLFVFAGVYTSIRCVNFSLYLVIPGGDNGNSEGGGEGGKAYDLTKNLIRRHFIDHPSGLKLMK